MRALETVGQLLLYCNRSGEGGPPGYRKAFKGRLIRRVFGEVREMGTGIVSSVPHLAFASARLWALRRLVARWALEL